jgi:predicted NUDIX family NTP pyrophosphohydrolase
MKQSSGTLLYRRTQRGLEVLLVHPSGNYNRKAPWGIPKGEPNEGESPEQAARRETLEETGLVVGELTDLGHVDYTRSRKRVYAFAGPAPDDCAPRCASWEIDQAEFVPVELARGLIQRDQVAFLDRLLALLGESTA